MRPLVNREPVGCGWCLARCAKGSTAQLNLAQPVVEPAVI